MGVSQNTPSNGVVPSDRTVISGYGALERVPELIRDRDSVVLLVDSAADICGTVEKSLNDAEIRTEVVKVDSGTVLGSPVGALETASCFAKVLTGSHAEAILAVGGGVTMDLCVVGQSFASDPRLEHLVRTRARRAGLVHLPRQTREKFMIAIPTTIGTGAEVSSVACVDLEDRHVLLVGEPLRYDAAVLDPRSTASLGSPYLTQGAFEAFLRVFGSMVCCQSTHLGSNREGTRIVEHLARTLITTSANCWDSPNRLSASELSAATHTGPALAGRGPYPWPLWYLANETATVTHVSKVEATIPYLRPWARRLVRGDLRWGDASIWEALSRRTPSLPSPRVVAEDVDAMQSWLRMWGIQCTRDFSREPATDQQAHRIAQRILASWGGDLPMLGRFDSYEICDLVEEALLRPAARTV
jgi:NADP-dependent alcohol dehydrogenase